MVELVFETPESEEGPGRVGWPEEQASLLIGRSSFCDVNLEDTRVSSVHCILVRGGDGSVVVRDLDSLNGTRVDGEEVEQSELPSDASFDIGNTSVRFEGSFAAADEEDGEDEDTSPASLLDQLQASPLRMAALAVVIGLFSFVLLGLLTFLLYSGTRKITSMIDSSRDGTVATERPDSPPSAEKTKRSDSASSPKDTQRETGSDSPDSPERKKNDRRSDKTDPSNTGTEQETTSAGRSTGTEEGDPGGRSVLDLPPARRFEWVPDPMPEDEEATDEDGSTPAKESPGDDGPSSASSGGDPSATPDEDPPDENPADGKATGNKVASKTAGDDESSGYPVERLIEQIDGQKTYWSDVRSWHTFQDRIRGHVRKNRYVEAADLLRNRADGFETELYQSLARRRAKRLDRVDALFTYVIQSINNGAGVVKQRTLNDVKAKPVSATREEYTVRGMNKSNLSFSIPWNHLSKKIEDVVHVERMSATHRVSLGALMLEEGRIRRGFSFLQSLYREKPAVRSRISSVVATFRDLPSAGEPFVPFQQSFVRRDEKASLTDVVEAGAGYPIKPVWGLADGTYLSYASRTNAFRFRGYEVQPGHPPLKVAEHPEDISFLLATLLPAKPIYLHRSYRFSKTFDGSGPMRPGTVRVHGTWNGFRREGDQIFLRLEQEVRAGGSEGAAGTEEKGDGGRIRDGTLRAVILFDPVRQRVHRVLTEGTLTFAGEGEGDSGTDRTVRVQARWHLADSRVEGGSVEGTPRVNLKKKRSDLYRRIQESIRRGKEFLRVMHGKARNRHGRVVSTGSTPFWSSPSSIPSHGGATALVLKALLESGMSRDEPVIEQAMNWLEETFYSRPPSEMPWLTTYSGSLGLMALESYIRPNDERQRASDFLWGVRRDFSFQRRKPSPVIRGYIERMTAWLLRRMRADHTWCAETRCRNETYGKVSTSTLENGTEVLVLNRNRNGWGARGGRLDPATVVPTEYAVLALRSAARCGVYIHPVYWKNILKAWLSTQSKRGPKVTLRIGRYGFPSVKREGRARAWTADTSTTAGGIAIVKMARNSLSELGALPDALAERADRSIRDGLAWLQDHYPALPPLYKI